MNKAQIFSLMAIFMSVLFVVLFGGLTHVALDKDVDIIETEIARFGLLAKSLDYFIHISLDSAGYQFLDASVDKLYTECGGNPTPSCYYSDYMAAFNACLTYGTYKGWNCTKDGSLIQNASYKAQLDNLTDILEERYNDLTVNSSKIFLSVSQIDPYTFRLTAQLNIVVERPNYKWDRYFNVSRDISIFGMRDPALAAKGYNHTIKVAPNVGDIYSIATFNSKRHTLLNATNNSYYFRDNMTGLSLVEMFEGVNITSLSGENHPFGINSILPLKLVEDEFGNLTNRSNISLVETHFIGNFTFDTIHSRYRLNPSAFPGVDDDIIFGSKFILRLGLKAEELLLVSDCCGVSNSTYGNDGACNSTCGKFSTI